MQIMKIMRIFSMVIVLMIFAFGLFYIGFLQEASFDNREVYEYYQKHFQEDIGIDNAVAAVLLSYRMYDTIFEAIIMLCSIIGIMHFLAVRKKEKDEGDKEGQ